MKRMHLTGVNADSAIEAEEEPHITRLPQGAWLNRHLPLAWERGSPCNQHQGVPEGVVAGVAAVLCAAQHVVPLGAASTALGSSQGGKQGSGGTAP